MKKKLVLHFTLAWTFLVVQDAALRADEGGKDSPKQFIEKWAAVFLENEVEKWMAFYDRSEDLRVIVSAGLHYEGFEAVEELYETSAEEAEFYESKVRKVKSRVLDDKTAIVSFEHRFKFRIPDGRRIRAHVRTTSVIRRVDGTWKIVHEHSSPIRGIERMVEIRE